MRQAVLLAVGAACAAGLTPAAPVGSAPVTPHAATATAATAAARQRISAAFSGTLHIHLRGGRPGDVTPSETRGARVPARPQHCSVRGAGAPTPDARPGTPGEFDEAHQRMVAGGAEGTAVTDREQAAIDAARTPAGSGEEHAPSGLLGSMYAAAISRIGPFEPDQARRPALRLPGPSQPQPAVRRSAAVRRAAAPRGGTSKCSPAPPPAAGADRPAAPRRSCATRAGRPLTGGTSARARPALRRRPPPPPPPSRTNWMRLVPLPVPTGRVSSLFP